MAVNEIAGATFKSESKTASDGTLALTYAAMRIASGIDSLMLVVAHCKESQADAHTVENAAFDPYVQRPLGADETVLAAFQAQLLEIPLEDRARVVAAARSPLAAGSSRSTRPTSRAPTRPPRRCASSSARRSPTAPARSSSATRPPRRGSAGPPCGSPARAPRPARTGATAT